MIRRIYRKLRRTYRQLTRKPYGKNPRYPAYWFNRARGGQETFVLQIGSNDGKTNDPLHALLQEHAQWRALLVEPIPYISERLRENYPDETRFQIATVAINAGKDLPFYYVDPIAKQQHPELPPWFDQLASFDRTHLTRHLDGILEPYIRVLDVRGITLEDLLKEQEVTQVDILHIDTEGYDWKVLQQLNLQAFQPDFILFERAHLSPQALNAAIDFLTPKYEVFSTDIDALGVSRRLPADIRTELDAAMDRLDKTTTL